MKCSSDVNADRQSTEVTTGPQRQEPAREQSDGEENEWDQGPTTARQSGRLRAADLREARRTGIRDRFAQPSIDALADPRNAGR